MIPVPQAEMQIQTLTQLGHIQSPVLGSDSPLYRTVPADFQACFRLPAYSPGGLNLGIAHSPIKVLTLARFVISSTEGRPRPQ